MRCVPILLTCGLLVLASPPAARAETAASPPASNDKVAAEALFREGRKLMSEARYAEACSKFEASQRLDPGVGTMLNLAECYEKTGRTASAWAEFREVISAAREADSREREELARRRADALETKLSRLTISLSTEATQIRGLEVRRDGTVLDSAEYGSAIPVDPGKHTIEATAPGRGKWFKALEIGADGAQEAVTIPSLPEAGETSKSTNVAVGQVTPDRVESSGSSSKKGVAIALGAVGVVGIGVGTYFGLKASSAWSDAKDGCGDYQNCSEGAIRDGDTARHAATASTIAFGVGIVGLASGTVLWFLSGPSNKDAAANPAYPVKPPKAATRIGVGMGSVVVRGNF
ncbi:MAG TPA: tetratricopeptide repeat protein [Polyangiaceae bacterium]|nr:tetratricopeptide repeat protein [Polyangiaceae bacterium]